MIAIVSLKNSFRATMFKVLCINILICWLYHQEKLKVFDNEPGLHEIGQWDIRLERRSGRCRASSLL